MFYARSQSNVAQHTMIQRSTAWIALLCYAVLLLHTVLVHMADLLPPSESARLSPAPTALAWVAHPEQSSQRDCQLCHIAGRHLQTSPGKGPVLPVSPAITPVISDAVVYHDAEPCIRYTSRAPPVS